MTPYNSRTTVALTCRFFPMFALHEEPFAVLAESQIHSAVWAVVGKSRDLKSALTKSLAHQPFKVTQARWDDIPSANRGASDP
jgi:hypothetical protein